ncbi:MAG: histidine phosphatase family protein [Xanthobacteraceae bacterium]|nr:histidine phosphatase family protein [Xanthobacteraceae bacterium]
MRRLILLRHAKTESHAPSGEDVDRRLDQRGEDDAASIGRWMADQRCRVGHALVSTAVRARQTWDIVAPLIGGTAAEVTHLADLYLADPADLLRAIHEAGGVDARCLVVVGHNPGLHELALMLTGSGDDEALRLLSGNLPTSGLVVLDFDIADWGDVGFRRGRLKCFVSPKLLRQSRDEV